MSLIGAAKLIIKWKFINNALASGSDEEHMRHAEGKTDKVRMALCKDEHFLIVPVVIACVATASNILLHFTHWIVFEQRNHFFLDQSKR